MTYTSGVMIGFACGAVLFWITIQLLLAAR